MSLIIPTHESEWLETAFHKVIRKRMAQGGGDQKSVIVACVALLVKAGLSCDPPLTEEEIGRNIIALVKERFRSPHALDMDRRVI
jgi:cyclophilin family peptidyl-prolyl cis-trans isomerase